MTTTQLAFGPVPSRRLGKSLGINNIPPEILHLLLRLLPVGAHPQAGCRPASILRT